MSPNSATVTKTGDYCRQCGQGLTAKITGENKLVNRLCVQKRRWLRWPIQGGQKPSPQAQRSPGVRGKAPWSWKSWKSFSLWTSNESDRNCRTDYTSGNMHLLNFLLRRPRVYAWQGRSRVYVSAKGYRGLLSSCSVRTKLLLCFRSG